MKQLNIHNLRLSVDAFDTDAVRQAHRVIAEVNDAISRCSGDPSLIIEGDKIVAEYEVINDE